MISVVDQVLHCGLACSECEYSECTNCTSEDTTSTITFNCLEADSNTEGETEDSDDEETEEEDEKIMTDSKICQ